MKEEVFELKKILNQEIETYLKLEQHILDKKETLIKGDIEKLGRLDLEIIKLLPEIQQFTIKRQVICQKLGCNSAKLEELIKIISTIEREEAFEINNSRSKLKKIIKKVQKENSIINDLINHGIKLVESSVKAITNVLIPESAAYNNAGKIKTNNIRERISSIVEEA